MRTRSPMVALCATLAIGAVACGRAPSPPAEAPSLPPASVRATSAPVPPLPASAASDPARPAGLPAGLPPDFPVPSGRVTGSTSMDVEEGASFTFAMSVAERPDLVLGWYGSELAAAGYSPGGALGTGEGEWSLTFTKGGQAEQGLVVIGPDAAGSRVSVTLTVER